VLDHITPHRHCARTEQCNEEIEFNTCSSNSSMSSTCSGSESVSVCCRRCGSRLTLCLLVSSSTEHDCTDSRCASSRPENNIPPALIMMMIVFYSSLRQNKTTKATNMSQTLLTILLKTVIHRPAFHANSASSIISRNKLRNRLHCCNDGH